MKKNSETISALPDFAPLYAWYRKHHRDLPFRRTRDPYAVWVSEIMLQQTRVAAMLPRYAAFMKQFPDAKTLALAREEHVIEAWQGLGYYSRARNLHRAARVVAELGAFPEDLPQALELPGVGEYTAAAVLSIAFGKEHAVVDGNVKRVLSRLFLQDSADGRAQAGLADRLIQGRDPGEHNQAVMELGALICLPQKPLCASCPLASECRAFQTGGEELASAIPPKKRTEKLSTKIEFLLDQTSQGVLFVRDAKSRFLKSHWMLPARVLIEGRMKGEHWVGQGGAVLGSVRHTITNHAITATLAKKGRARFTMEGLETERFTLNMGQRKAASSLMQKILRLI